MRGKAVSHIWVCQRGGITPAYAGKSSFALQHLSTAWDHPRLCGEKKDQMRRSGSLGGSPPPMRGKVSGRDDLCAGVRITPAYAGKSTLTFPFFTVYWDHPRLCGEKRRTPRSWRFSSGSPPPMRGKAGEAWQKNNQSRITPAYAGKSDCFSFQRYSPKDHPRLCGEKGKPGVLVTEEQGSPPPMRGKEFPACPHQRRTLDHPRLCGEKSCVCAM